MEAQAKQVVAGPGKQVAGPAKQVAVAGTASSKKNAGPNRAEMNQAAKIMDNVTSMANKNMNDEQDEVASVHSRDSDHVQVYVDDVGTHHYVEEDDHQDYHQDHSNTSSFDTSGFDTRAMSRAASSFMAAAQGPPKNRATSSANNGKLPGSSSGNPNAGPNSNSNSASQKAAMKNAKGAAKALSSVNKFLTANGMKFW